MYFLSRRDQIEADWLSKSLYKMIYRFYCIISIFFTLCYEQYPISDMNTELYKIIVTASIRRGLPITHQYHRVLSSSSLYYLLRFLLVLLLPHPCSPCSCSWYMMHEVLGRLVLVTTTYVVVYTGPYTQYPLLQHHHLSLQQKCRSARQPHWWWWADRRVIHKKQATTQLLAVVVVLASVLLLIIVNSSIIIISSWCSSTSYCLATTPCHHEDLQMIIGDEYG